MNLKKLEMGLGELLLLFFILINIGEFIKITPPDWEFVEQILAMLLLAILFYKASITRILFGNKNRHIDLLIILSYFMLIFETVVELSKVALEETKYAITKLVYEYIITNKFSLELIFFYIGILLLAIVSIYMTFKFCIKKPSLMHVIHEEGPPPSNPFHKIGRSFILFLILNAFFLFVFHLIIEWFAVAVDDPLLIIGIFLYLVIILKHHKKFHPEHFIYKIGSFGEDFYQKIISFFHYKKTILLAVSGILILHLITDTFVFISPHLTTLQSSLYLQNLPSGEHTLIPQLFKTDVTQLTTIAKPFIFLAYYLNLIGIASLILIPIIIWYRLFRGKPLTVARPLLSLMFSSIITLLILPVFRIKSIQTQSLAGVDITSRSILQSKLAIYSLLPKETAITAVILFAVVVGIAVFVLSHKEKAKKDLFIISAIAGLIFFSLYVYSFLKSTISYYSLSITNVFQLANMAVLIMLAIYLALEILFYLIGFITVVYETRMEYHHGKWSNPVDKELRHALKNIHGWEKHHRH